MPFIRLKETSSSQKHQVEDIEWSEKVSELKNRASKVTNIPVVEQSKPAWILFSFYRCVDFCDFYFED